MDRGRFEAFSDGVFAVAITLLALDLAVPGPGHGPLGTQLTDRWPALAGYAVSFLTIGIIWVNHHALCGNFADVNRPLLFLNLLLLFFVVAIPFATSTFAEYLRVGGPDASLAGAIYEVVFTGMGLSFALLFFWAVRGEHLRAPLSSAAARRAIVRFGIGNVAYIAAIGFAFVSPISSLVISGLVAVYYVFEHTPGGPAQPSGSQA